MKKKYIRIVVWSSVFITLVLATNLTIINYFLSRDYTYSNYNGTYRHSELRMKGRPYESRDKSYRTFLKQNPQIKDKQLYRTFTLDPWRFWEWREWYYRFDRFTLPYISERTIQRNKEQKKLDNSVLAQPDSIPKL